MSGPSVGASLPATPPEVLAAAFADDVRYYLTLSPRQLPSRYLYDALGSALFEAICHLPWYLLTRGETRLLDTHREDILDGVAPLGRIVELGAGSGDKLARLLAPAAHRWPRLHVHLVDVSPTALRLAAQTLAPLGRERIFLHQAPYESGLRDATGHHQNGGRSLVLFLGSNIGNFDPPGAEALLRQVRASLMPGDGLLIGVDLVKPAADLLLAYDDPLQVTAAFNRNLLVRMNSELAANFDVQSFSHRAVWNDHESRVEMHLVSTATQRVTIPAADLEVQFAAGESIWTESSYKYEPDALTRLFRSTGFEIQKQWVDDISRFALTLLRTA